MWAKKAFSDVRHKLLLLCVLGVILALNWVFFFSALIYTDIAKATLIYYLAPMLMVVLSSVFLRERITRKRLFLVFLAFLGALIIGTQAEFSLGNKDFLGVVFALLGAIFYASVTVLDRYLRDVDSTYLTFSSYCLPR